MIDTTSRRAVMLGLAAIPAAAVLPSIAFGEDITPRSIVCAKEIPVPPRIAVKALLISTAIKKDFLWESSEIQHPLYYADLGFLMPNNVREVGRASDVNNVAVFDTFYPPDTKIVVTGPACRQSVAFLSGHAGDFDMPELPPREVVLLSYPRFVRLNHVNLARWANRVPEEVFFEVEWA